MVNAKVRILGTSAENIDKAEDRAKFSSLLDDLDISQPQWRELTRIREVEEFAGKVGYPVLVRPSYVLSGAAMTVAYSRKQLKNFLEAAASVTPEHPVVVSKFIENAKEIEVDAVSDGEDILIGAIIEHIERAGVHSGDATMTIPPLTIPENIKKKIEGYTREIAKSLQIKGPFNIQYMEKEGKVYVIECNLRASRSMPYVSKTTGINLMDVSAAVILGRKLKELKIKMPPINWYCVKSPQFSFMRLDGADPILGVEMRSTGEVAAFGDDFFEAFIKSLTAAEFILPNPEGNVLITVGGQKLKREIAPIAKKLANMKFRIFATEHTTESLKKYGITNVETLYKISEPHRKPNILDYLVEKKIDLVINIPSSITLEKYVGMLEDEYKIRRKAVEFGIPVLTDLEATKALVESIEKSLHKKPTIKSLNELHSSLPWTHW